jgi:exodeoxyribonuclease-3
MNNKNELKFISWNVNGIRAILNKGFLENIKSLDADFVCLQEIKAHPEQIDDKIKDIGYKYEFWNPAQRKGYSGTALFSRIKPINVFYNIEGIDEDLLTNEGRVIVAEFENFFLINLYVPNAKRDLSRLDLKTKKWWPSFINYVSKLKDEKGVIICGDLNVAHTEMDLKNPQTNKTTKTKPGSAGFTDTERSDFDKLLNAGFIDTFRYLYPKEIKYTWWSYMFNARSKNIGWRIDYFLISENLRDNLKDSKIHDDILGSDHCPIELDLKF